MLIDRSVRAAAGLDAVPEHIKVGFSCFPPYYQGPGKGHARGGGYADRVWSRVAGSSACCEMMMSYPPGSLSWAH